MTASNLHLVDEEGRALDKCVEAAINRHEPEIRKKFARYCDPAEFSTAIEETGSRIDKTVRDRPDNSDPERVGGLTWQSIYNRGVSFVRRYSAEQRASAEFARRLALVRANSNHEEAIIARETGRQILSQLSERDRIMCALEAEGVSDDEIAAHLKMTKAAVHQARWRRRQKVAELTSRKYSSL